MNTLKFEANLDIKTLISNQSFNNHIFYVRIQECLNFIKLPINEIEERHGIDQKFFEFLNKSENEFSPSEFFTDKNILCLNEFCTMAKCSYRDILGSTNNYNGVDYDNDDFYMNLQDEIHKYKDYIDVLNGIAFNSESKTFYITGKFWPILFELKIE